MDLAETQRRTGLRATRMARRQFLRLAAGLAGGLALASARSVRALAQLEEEILVPPTLMLHPRDKDRSQLARLLEMLTDEGYESILYRDLSAILRGDAAMPERPFMLTIDDLGSHFVEPPHMALADIVEESGHRASFGIVTRDTPERSPAVWDIIRGLAARGFEMNTHTTDHAILSDLESVDDIRYQVIGSADMIEEAIGVRPLALIVPYGDVYLPDRYRVFDQRIFDVAAEGGLEFVVGIVEGRRLAAAATPPYFLGRVGVGVDHYQTFWWLTHFYE